MITSKSFYDYLKFFFFLIFNTKKKTNKKAKEATEKLCLVFETQIADPLKQTSAQREHDKNVSVFVRSICITQRKIVSIYSVKQCSKKYSSE